jgi:hypothetical protein
MIVSRMRIVASAGDVARIARIARRIVRAELSSQSWRIALSR